MIRTAALALAAGFALAWAGWTLWSGDTATALMLLVLAAALGATSIVAHAGDARRPAAGDRDRNP